MVKAQVRVYLAHTFKHRKYVKEVLTPRINALGILTRNPFYESDGTTKLEGVKIADDEKCNNTEEERLRQMARSGSGIKVVQRDLGYVDRTDFTIAYMTDISAGTTSEIFYTGVIKRRPVFLLTDNNLVSNHPWIIYSCRRGKICKTLDELIRVLKKRYG
jgi:hypothetical protein